jgi:hypothetical protein
MKTSRIILTIGIAHSVLLWTSYAILHMADFDIFNSSHNSPIVNGVFDLTQILSVPLVSDSFYAFTKHLPFFAFITLNSCIWAACLGALIYGYRRLHTRAA